MIETSGSVARMRTLEKRKGSRQHGGGSGHLAAPSGQVLALGAPF